MQAWLRQGGGPTGLCEKHVLSFNTMHIAHNPAVVGPPPWFRRTRTRAVAALALPDVCFLWRRATSGAGALDPRDQGGRLKGGRMPSRQPLQRRITPLNHSSSEKAVLSRCTRHAAHALSVTVALFCRTASTANTDAHAAVLLCGPVRTTGTRIFSPLRGCTASTDARIGQSIVFCGALCADFKPGWRENGR